MQRVLRKEAQVSPNVMARNLTVTGRVQGVGYRPFVYRLAHELGLTGWVLNGAGKVFIHAEGPQTSLDQMETALVDMAPPLARPKLAASEHAPINHDVDFIIRASHSGLEPEIHIPPDLFTCDSCLEELRDPADRRYRYPFINCTQCGPRYTIIRAMPYDRPNTSMKDFPLCAPCHKDYTSVLDRRFHAQPLACPECGPSLTFRKGEKFIANSSKALSATIATLHAGGIVAVKGIGGYHLMCCASNREAVQKLRHRKHRPDKPLAVMFPLQGEGGLDGLSRAVALTQAEAMAISAPERPVVLVRKRADFPLASSLAPNLAELGAFLPYSPLHHILLGDFGAPLVATSGNISGEPVITDNNEADIRLNDIADAFLHHNRPIVRPADDPVVRVICGKARAIRLGRGTAPLELDLPNALDRPVIAVGGHMKNTVALAWDKRIVISPHIGDLDSPRSLQVFRRVIDDLQALYGVKAETILCDLHPGYSSSKWASSQDLPVIKVQHHQAHASAIAGEHPDIKKWLVFTWDGVGYGDDGSFWGGEAFVGTPGHWHRSASFMPFHLLGGDKAGREPWRSAAAIMWEAGLDWLPEIEGATLAVQAWKSKIQTYETSAVGRLFDAAACIIAGRDIASFEGQGPMELESLAQDTVDGIPLPLVRDSAGIVRSDWRPLLPMLANEGLSKHERASIFHESMAQALVAQTLALRGKSDFDAVGLTGGVFQNRVLCERVVTSLKALGIDVRLHDEVPMNDGGLCFGQVIHAVAHTKAIKTRNGGP